MSDKNRMAVGDVSRASWLVKQAGNGMLDKNQFVQQMVDLLSRLEGGNADHVPNRESEIKNKIVQFQVVRASTWEWYGEQRSERIETVVYALDANGRLWAHNQDTNEKWEVKPLPNEPIVDSSNDGGDPNAIKW